MKSLLNNVRFLYVMLCLASVIGMGYALYLQHVVHLAPCPLCIFQRIGLVVMGIFSLIAAIIHPKKAWAKLMLWLGSFVGILWSLGVAARHVWLTYLPADQVPACGPGLNYWVDTLPLLQVFQEVLKGSGECATVDWRLLGLSIPEQALIFFVGLALVHLWLLVLSLKKQAV